MVNNMGFIVGIVYLIVDGVNYQLEGELKYDVGSVMCELKVGQDMVYGFSEMLKVLYISVLI